MNSPKDAGFLFIHAYVFLQIQRESFSIFVGLISDSRLFHRGMIGALPMIIYLL